MNVCTYEYVPRHLLKDKHYMVVIHIVMLSFGDSYKSFFFFIFVLHPIYVTMVSRTIKTYSVIDAFSKT